MMCPQLLVLGKKSKSPVVKLMKGLLNSFNSDCDKSNTLITELVNSKKLKEQKKEEIAESLTNCQRLAVECGAAEDSVEYFCATQLFASKHNRVMFKNISTKEARFMWLRRWCQQKNLY